MERAYVYGSWIRGQSKFKGDERFIYNLTFISQPYINLVWTIIFEEVFGSKNPSIVLSRVMGRRQRRGVSSW